MVLTGVDAHSDCGFAFPACDASAETVSELTECLIHHHAIPHRVSHGVLTKELTSQQEKCDGGPTVLESSSLTIFPINLKQLG